MNTGTKPKPKKECLLPLGEGCQLGRFIRREKRFSVAVQVEGGELWAHTNNTGSLLGLLREGAPVLLSAAVNPARKLAWTLELIWNGGSFLQEALLPNAPERFLRRDGTRGFWTGVNTSMPNKLLEAAFYAGQLPWAKGYTRFMREKKRAESRLDACLEGPGLPRLWVECKNVTLVEDEVALFPDAVSARGLKHLAAMMDIRQRGERAATFYCIQRPDGRCFAPADMIDKAYGERFYEALQAGVEMHPHMAVVSPAGIDLGKEIPVRRADAS